MANALQVWPNGYSYSKIAKAMAVAVILVGALAWATAFSAAT
jgi:hypothetical protein